MNDNPFPYHREFTSAGVTNNANIKVVMFDSWNNIWLLKQ